MKRTRFIPIVLLVVLGLAAAACSGGQSDSARIDGDAAVARSAAGATDPAVSVNVDEFCSTFTRAGFLTAAELATCFVLDNQTRKFDRPGSLGAKFELFVPKAECGVKSNAAGDPCVKTPKRYGEIRDHQNGDVYGARVPTPNPFLNLAAVQFQSAAMYAGTEELVYVGSKQAPMNLDMLPAKAFFSNPYSQPTFADCRGDGQFLSCEVVANSWSQGGDWQRPRYVFRTQPLEIQIANGTGRPIEAKSAPVVGPGLLIDPAGTSSNLSSIPDKATAYVGAYRSPLSMDGQTWTGNYVIKGLSQDFALTITIKLAFDSTAKKWISQSTCAVGKAQTVVYKCDVSMNESDDYRIATVSVTNF